MSPLALFLEGIGLVVAGLMVRWVANRGWLSRRRASPLGAPGALGPVLVAHYGVGPESSDSSRQSSPMHAAGLALSFAGLLAMALTAFFPSPGSVDERPTLDELRVELGMLVNEARARMSELAQRLDRLKAKGMPVGTGEPRHLSPKPSPAAVSGAADTAVPPAHGLVERDQARPPEPVLPMPTEPSRRLIEPGKTASGSNGSVAKRERSASTPVSPLPDRLRSSASETPIRLERVPKGSSQTATSGASIPAAIADGPETPDGPPRAESRTEARSIPDSHAETARPGRLDGLAGTVDRVDPAKDGPRSASDKEVKASDVAQTGRDDPRSDGDRLQTPTTIDRTTGTAKVEKADKFDKQERFGRIENAQPPGKPERVERFEKVEKIEVDRPTKPERMEKIDKVERLDKPERAQRVERPERVEKVEKVERLERPAKPERVERIERVEKVEKIERPTKPERIEKVEKIERPAKPERVEKVEKIERPVKPERVEKVEKVEKVERPTKPERAEKPEKPTRPGK